MESANNLPLIDQLKVYLETKYKIFKYGTINGASAIIAGVITHLVIAFAILILFLFANVLLALLAGYWLNSYWAGFGCVTLLYALTLVLTWLLKVVLQNKFIKIATKKYLKLNHKLNNQTNGTKHSA